MGTYTVWPQTTESVFSCTFLNVVLSFTCTGVLPVPQERDSSVLALNQMKNPA